MLAAWQGELETARVLWAAGADPDAVSVAGRTALDYARQDARTDTVAWLERIGAREAPRDAPAPTGAGSR